MQVILSQPPWAGAGVAVASPYDPNVIAAIKNVPGRVWNASHKAWIIPGEPEHVRGLIDALASLRTSVVLEPALREALNARVRALAAARETRRAGDAADWGLLSTPYAHQRAGLAFLRQLGSGALLWEMGTGKTAAAIAYCEWMAGQPTRQGIAERPDLRVLVICPNTVKRNWCDEIEKHAGHADYVVPDGPLVKRAKLVGSARYTILNCEALSLRPTAEAVLAREWDVVIVDESTRFKSPTAKRTKALHKLRAQRRVILTGSPITGKPEDAWAQFEFVAPGLFGSWWSFSDRYLVKDFFKRVVGVKASMVEDLRAKIGSRSYRLLKSEVLDLPEKVYETRWVTLEGEQRKAYEQMRDELRIAIEDVDISAPTILTQLLRLTQVTAGLAGERDRYRWLTPNAKLTELEHLLDDELAGEQVVIFGVYQKELEWLAARFTPGALVPIRSIRGPGLIVDGDFGKAIDPAIDLPIIYGPTPESVRHQYISEFQSGRQRLLFVQAHSGGIGINLTAARTAIYYTRSWSLEDYLQSQDRLHRIGQTGTVTIVHLAARGTVDEAIAKALSAKQNLADHLTGDDARRLAAQLLEKS